MQVPSSGRASEELACTCLHSGLQEDMQLTSGSRRRACVVHASGIGACNMLHLPPWCSGCAVQKVAVPHTLDVMECTVLGSDPSSLAVMWGKPATFLQSSYLG